MLCWYLIWFRCLLKRFVIYSLSSNIKNIDYCIWYLRYYCIWYLRYYSCRRSFFVKNIYTKVSHQSILYQYNLSSKQCVFCCYQYTLSIFCHKVILIIFIFLSIFLQFSIYNYMFKLQISTFKTLNAIFLKIWKI